MSVTPKALRILVADDHPDVLRLCELMLHGMGHQAVSFAHTGVELLEAFDKCLPDLVVTDVSMPFVDGITASTQIWTRRPVPIVMVSAHYADRLLENAHLDHVMAYLTKPISPRSLEGAIDSAQASAVAGRSSRRANGFRAPAGSIAPQRQASDADCPHPPGGPPAP